MTAARLAEALEVSTRTIYRDVLDLIASGVPITGEAGVGYQLDPSYRLPPLTFAGDEIEALAIGMRMVEAWGDADLRRAARSVLAKADAVLGAEEQTQLEQTALFALAFGRTHEVSRHLGELRQAINRRQVIDISYQDEQQQASERSVRPLGLFFWGQAWTLAAWCELRSAFRNFRTDRIQELEVSERTFELVSPCTLEDYVRVMREQP